MEGELSAGEEEDEMEEGAFDEIDQADASKKEKKKKVDIKYSLCGRGKCCMLCFCPCRMKEAKEKNRL